EPIWNSVSGVIGARLSRLAKPKSSTVENPPGVVSPRVSPGRSNWRRWSSPWARMAAIAPARAGEPCANAGAASRADSAALSAPAVNARLVIAIEPPFCGRDQSPQWESQAGARSGFAALALVGDGRTLGVARQRGIAGRQRRPGFVRRLLHARAPVRQPVDVDDAVVLAAIGLAGGDRRGQL